MPPVYDQHGITVLHGDCLDVLAGLPDSSVDAVVTDPPYGLGNPDPAYVIKALERWFAGDRAHVPDSKGFMGRAWDAFVPPPAVWDECLRVLKPGGHLLAFAGSRTYDLMTLSIRLAGFEIRDGIDWVYASGFPKSLDVGKAIDKSAGAERDVIGTATRKTGSATYDKRPSRPTGLYASDNYDITAPATDAARQWQGFGTALKPAHEPVVVAQKPASSAHEPIVMARKPLSGNTVAANVLAHGTGALNIDGCRVAGADSGWTHNASRTASFAQEQRPWKDRLTGDESWSGGSAGRWPSNVVLTHAPNCAVECSPGCPVAELDAQSGTSKSKSGGMAGTKSSGGLLNNTGEQRTDARGGFDDGGGASRFFAQFRYQAKAPTSERPRVNGIAHSTVKPLALMSWLVRLVTPPGGTVLDPFLGSGTTAQAARDEGFRCIGIEREAEYLDLIRARLDRQPPTSQRLEQDALPFGDPCPAQQPADPAA